MSRAAYIARVALLAATYAIVARLGLLLDPVHGFATLVWPPTGIALAALLVMGARFWPGIALGAFVVNVWVGGSLAVAAGAAVGNTLEAVLAAYALTRIPGFDRSLSRLRDVAALVIIAATLSTMVSATIGVTSLLVGGVITWEHFGETWAPWWVGDMIGDLVVAPMLLAWSVRAPGTRKHVAERIGVAVTLVSSCLLVFGPSSDSIGPAFRQPLLLAPVLIWASVRFGPRGVTLATLACCAFAIWGTALGHGPFVRPVLHHGLLELQVFMAVIAATFLHLAALTSERGSSLARERSARELAERSVTARDDFIAIASHELKTPLTPLHLQLDVLYRALSADPSKRDSKDLANRVRVSLRQTRRLARLVESLLDVSTLSSGQLELHVEELDFSQLVRDVVEQLHDEASALECEVSVRASAPVVGTWDRLRVERVVANLLSNATKFGRGKPVDVRVSSDASSVTLEVVDRGPGIDPESVPRIFERYERATSSKHQGGLGLGLYIAREIAVAHGGTLKAERGADAGSVFTLVLPLMPDAAGRPRKPE